MCWGKAMSKGQIANTLSKLSGVDRLTKRYCTRAMSTAARIIETLPPIDRSRGNMCGGNRSWNQTNMQRSQRINEHEHWKHNSAGRKQAYRSHGLITHATGSPAQRPLAELSFSSVHISNRFRFSNRFGGKSI